MLRSVQAYHQDVQRLRRHRLQLRRRPLRAHLGGPRRRHHQRRGRRAQPGLQHRRGGRRRRSATTATAGVTPSMSSRSPGSSPGSSRSTASIPRSTVPFTSAGSAKYAAGTTVTLPPRRRPPRRAGHELPRHEPDTRASGTIRTRVAPAGAELPGRARAARCSSPTSPATASPTRSSTGPAAAPTCSGAPRASGAFAKAGAPVAGAYRPAVGRLRRQRLRRHPLARHRLGGRLDLVVRPERARPARPCTVNGSYVPIVGDFDGNGIDDIFWYATGPGRRLRVVLRATGRQHRSMAVRRGPHHRRSRSSATSTATAATTSSSTAPAPARRTRMWLSTGPVVERDRRGR